MQLIDCFILINPMESITPLFLGEETSQEDFPLCNTFLIDKFP